MSSVGFNKAMTSPSGGGSSSVNYQPFIAGENINSGQPVIMWTDAKIYVYDISNPAHYGLSVGIAKQSGAGGTTIDVYTTEVATDPGAGWDTGYTYYVNQFGLLSKNPPPAPGIVKIVGVCIAKDQILIKDGIEVITS